MKNLQVLYGIIGFLAGIVIAILFTANAVNNNMTDMMRMMGINQGQKMISEREEMMGHDESMSMQEMSDTLQGKTGEQFDEAFITLMIKHHEGAIDMANLAKTNASHQEIKELADDIISAQTKEIEMMQSWQKEWSY